MPSPARQILGLSNTTAAGLQTAANAALAAISATPIIRGLSLAVHDAPQYLGLQYNLQVSYDINGGALGTPFLIAIDEKGSLAALVAAIQARYVANAAYFWAAPILYRLNPGNKLPIFGAVTLYNTTGGASANFATLNPGGAN